MLTLWDLIEPIARRMRGKGREKTPGEAQRANRDATVRERGVDTNGAAGVGEREGVRNAAGNRRSTKRSLTVASLTNAEAGAKRKSEPMQAKYDRMIEVMLRRHNVRVRRWRTAMSGVAWRVEYRDGTIVNLIESPKPKGPMSAAVFLHEIGHHAIGLEVYKPRCLEEYHAWMFALAAMEEHDLTINEGVRRRVRKSLEYAVRKATRRGLKRLPAELVEYA